MIFLYRKQNLNFQTENEKVKERVHANRPNCASIHPSSKTLQILQLNDLVILVDLENLVDMANLVNLLILMNLVKLLILVNLMKLVILVNVDFLVNFTNWGNLVIW